MSSATYKTWNLFSRIAASDGTVAGPSMEVIGLSEDAVITFDNAGGAEVVMQQQRTVNSGPWANIGAITIGQAYSFRMRLVSGFRYRFLILTAGSSAVDVNCRSILNEGYHMTLGSLYSEGFPLDENSTDGNGNTNDALAASFTPIEDDTQIAETGGRYKVYLPDAIDANTFYGPAVAPSTDLVASRRLVIPPPGAKGDSFQVIVDASPSDMPVFLDGNVNGVVSGAYQYAENQLVTFVSDGTTWEPHYSDGAAGGTSTPGVPGADASVELLDFNSLTLPFAKPETPFNGVPVAGGSSFNYSYPEALAAFTAMNAEVGDTATWKTPIGGHTWLFTLHEDDKISATWPTEVKYFFTSNETPGSEVLTALAPSQVNAGYRWDEIDLRADGFGVSSWISTSDETPFKYDTRNVLADTRNRKITSVDTDTSFANADFIRGLHQSNVILKDGDVTLVYDEDIVDESIIEVGVSWDNPPNKLLLVAGDGTVVKFRDNREGVDSDGMSVIRVESDAVFVKDGNFWNQIRGRCSCMPEPVGFAVTGSFDESDPFSLLININEATGGSGTYTDYSLTLDFVDADDAPRSVTVNGLLTDTPSATGFSGTIANIVIDNAAADLYRIVNMDITVTDDAGATTTESL